MLIIKSRESAEGMELPNQESMKTLGEKVNYKYWGILEVNTFKQTEMRKNTPEGRESFSKPKLCCRNFIKGINTSAVLLARYSGTFFKWIRKITYTNGLKNKQIDFNAQGVTSSTNQNPSKIMRRIKFSGILKNKWITLSQTEDQT